MRTRNAPTEFEIELYSDSAATPRGFIPEEPDPTYRKCGIVTSACADEANSSPSDPALDLGSEYFSIWQMSSNANEALSRIQTRYGAAIGQALFPIESHVDISILNDDGDAKITRNILAANIGFEPLADTLVRLWLETSTPSLSVLAYEQMDGKPLEWEFAANDTHKKEIAVNFDSPVDPLGTVAYAVEFSVAEMFEKNSFWFERIRSGLTRQSFSLRFNDGSALKDFHAVLERPDGASVPGMPRCVFDSYGQSARIRWEMLLPPARSLIKTFWWTEL